MILPFPLMSRWASQQLLSLALAPHPLILRPSSGIPSFKKYPIDDLDLIQLLHIKYKQGIVKELEKEQDPRVKSKQLSLTESWKNPTFDNNKAESETSEAANDDKPTKTIPHWPIPTDVFHTPSPYVNRTMAAFIFLTSFSKPPALSPFP